MKSSSSSLIPVRGIQGTLPIARSSKMIGKNSKCTKLLHLLLHLALIAGSLAVIYWGLVMGRVFLYDEKDYTHNPHIIIPQPVEPSDEGKDD